jgi:hypothetical protein
MAHRHLILAYVLTWVLQLGYVGFLAVKWWSEKRGDRSLHL